MAEKKDSTALPGINYKVVIARFIFTTLLMGGILFLSAGTLRWWQGWVYMVTSLVMLLGSRYILIKRYPETAAERMAAGKKENTQSWDKILVPLVAIYLPMSVWVIAGFEKRFSVSAGIPIWGQIAAFMISIGANVFSNWALFRNRFFSSHVRIQNDRGHYVVKDGPYAIVRHPGYAGGFVYFLATPIFFNSWWTWIPSLATCVLYIYRIIKEEETLAEGLPGYKGYMQEVRYRIFPGIW